MFSFSIAKADTAAFEIPLQVENAEKAIWKIHTLDHHGNGTGFFIGPNPLLPTFMLSLSCYAHHLKVYPRMV